MVGTVYSGGLEHLKVRFCLLIKVMLSCMVVMDEHGFLILHQSCIDTVCYFYHSFAA